MNASSSVGGDPSERVVSGTGADDNIPQRRHLQKKRAGFPPAQEGRSMGISDSSQRPPTLISSTILRGVQSHDEEAWNRFYAIWQPIVYALCRRAGVAPQDAEEIVQNVFLKISHGIGGFERQSFRAWIQTITRTTMIDHQRSCQNCPAVFGGTGTWIEKIEDRRVSQDRASDGDFADDDVESVPESSQEFLVHRLLEVVAKDFHPTTYQAFERTVLENARPLDVAKELGITAKAVRAAKYRVLKRVREEMEGIV
jgi:RNA polymerase sigma-70 factor, ECF subfamily